MHLGDLRRLRVLLNEIAVTATKKHPELRADCYRFLLDTYIDDRKNVDVKSPCLKTYLTVCAKTWFYIATRKKRK